MPLALDKVHALIKTKFELEIIRGGQDQESPPLPYIQYDLIINEKYNNYQILKETRENGPIIESEYKNPTYETYQYSVIGDEGQLDVIKTEDLYNFMTTQIFKIAINAENIFHTILSDVTEVNINKQEFFERRFLFEVRFAWSNNFIENETAVSAIETAGGTREPAMAPQ